MLVIVLCLYSSLWDVTTVFSKATCREQSFILFTNLETPCKMFMNFMLTLTHKSNATRFLRIGIGFKKYILTLNIPKKISPFSRVDVDTFDSYRALLSWNKMILLKVMPMFGTRMSVNSYFFYFVIIITRSLFVLNLLK